MRATSFRMIIDRSVFQRCTEINRWGWTQWSGGIVTSKGCVDSDSSSRRLFWELNLDHLFGHVSCANNHVIFHNPPAAAGSSGTSISPDYKGSKIYNFIIRQGRTSLRNVRRKPNTICSRIDLLFRTPVYHLTKSRSR